MKTTLSPEAGRRRQLARSRFMRAAGPLLVALFIAVLSACGYFVSPRSAALPDHARAPDFTLVDHRGEKVGLGPLLERGPAVIVFYRGFW